MEEAFEVMRKEERRAREIIESGGVPVWVCKDFLQVSNIRGEKCIVNVNHIVSIHQSTTGGLFVYLLDEEDALYLRHSYSNFIKAMKER